MALIDDPADGVGPADTIVFSTEGNPVPKGGIAGHLSGFDGKRLRYALFPSPRKPARGTVVVLPGRNECIEKYFETIGDLRDRGFCVAIMDWRGQGGSERLLRDPLRGYVESFRHYRADLDRFFTDIILPDCPGRYYILAHSTGALVALTAAPELANRVERMVLCAPLLELTGLPISTRSVHRLASFLFGLGLGTIYLGGSPSPNGEPAFAGNRLTSDPRRFARNVAIFRERPSLATGGPTVGWLRAACIAIEEAGEAEFMARLRVPMLFVAAGRDEVVSTAAIEAYVSRLRAGSLVTIDGAMHEIMQEADIYRDQFLAAFDAYIPGSG